MNPTPQKVDMKEVANFISWAHLKLQVGTMLLEDCLRSGNRTSLIIREMNSTNTGVPKEVDKYSKDKPC